MAAKANTIKIDSSIDWERRLHYQEKHSGWMVFKALYWGIYIFVVGIMIIFAGYTGFSLIVLSGWAIMLFAIFVIMYGLVMPLHYKFIKKHG